MRQIGLLALLASCCAHAQIGQPFTYPEFRSMSGLPGSGYGVGPDGGVRATGAWSISTPIAYSLKPWQFVVGIANFSDSLTPKFWDSNEHDLGGNGTGQALMGLPFGRFGQATFSYMILSKKLDSVLNFHWAPPGQRGPLRYAVGVQDIDGGGGVQGESLGWDRNSSRSYFAVATWQGSSDLYVSLGTGSNRFAHVFGNASYSLSPRVKAVIENDRFNWNCGFGYDLGRLGSSPRAGAETGASLFLGVIAGKYAYWSLNLRF